MNYEKLYFGIIDGAKRREIDDYTEKHHIKPKSLGGSDSVENLVSLTAREHFLCHYLLTKMYDKETNEWYKMVHAFLMMKAGSVKMYRYFNSRLYETLKRELSVIQSLNQNGEKNSNYGNVWIHNLELKNIKIGTQQRNISLVG